MARMPVVELMDTTKRIRHAFKLLLVIYVNNHKNLSIDTSEMPVLKTKAEGNLSFGHWTEFLIVKIHDVDHVSSMYIYKRSAASILN